MLPPEIVASPGPVTSDEKITKKEVVQQTPTKPPAPSSASVSTISSFGASAVSVPAVEFEAPEETVELGSSFGSGLSFGAGSMAAGGEISFMGNSGAGSRVVFAVDMSLSMGGFALDQKPPPSEEADLRDRQTQKLKHQLLRSELAPTASESFPRGPSTRLSCSPTRPGPMTPST